jgi:hypothetical protein
MMCPDVRGTCTSAHGALLLCTAVVSLSLFAEPARAAYAPRVAIVQCPDSYAIDPFSSDASSQGLVGLAGLVGVPYQTLTLAQLVASDANDLTSIWFSSCPFLTDAHHNALVGFLDAFSATGGSVFLDGPIGTIAVRTGGLSYRGMYVIAQILGIGEGDYSGLGPFNIETTEAVHPVSMLAPPGPILAANIYQGVDTLIPANPGSADTAVLLELTSTTTGNRLPFLTAVDHGGGRALGISSYGSWAGVASPFQNDGIRGFYDNHLLPYLLTSLEWLIGEDGAPFVGLQLSHAPITAIGRLDGDWSQVPSAAARTLDYLNGFAQLTGMASVYGIVSEFAEQGGWEPFVGRGATLEFLGGSIGSHSATHNNDMSQTLNSAGWTAEVAGSLATIAARLTAQGFVPDANVFINPGDTILSEDYGQFFDSVAMFMTHGAEDSVPYASGVMGFGLPTGVAPKPVVNNTPIPDFQWLYHPDWVYPVESAAAHQSDILNFYQHTVGRGALYNQMWHDYAIGAQLPPIHDSAASPMPLYDANLAHFAANPFYAPSIPELIGKLWLAYAVDLVSTASNGTLTVTLDMSALHPSVRTDLAGMGLRVAHTASQISSVKVDGKPYAAFADSTVILPPTAATLINIEIALAQQPSAEPRMTFISKPFTSIVRDSQSLRAPLRHPGLATRFCLAGPTGLIVLGASRFSTAAGQRCGQLDYGSAVKEVAAALVDTGTDGLTITASDRPILAGKRAGDQVVLELAGGAPGTLTFTAAAMPTVAVDGIAAVPVDSAGIFSLPITSTLPVSVALSVPPCEATNSCPRPEPDPEHKPDAELEPPSDVPGHEAKEPTAGDGSSPTGPGADHDGPTTPSIAAGGCVVATRSGPASPGCALLAIFVVAVLLPRRRAR